MPPLPSCSTTTKRASSAPGSTSSRSRGRSARCPTSGLVSPTPSMLGTSSSRDTGKDNTTGSSVGGLAPAGDQRAFRGAAHVGVVVGIGLHRSLRDLTFGRGLEAVGELDADMGAETREVEVDLRALVLEAGDAALRDQAG